MKKILLMILTILTCMSIFGCTKNEAQKDPWESAVYTEDTEFGTGKKTVLVEVKVLDKAVTFTLKTNDEMLGDALSKHDIISGEKGPYGLYVKKVNGILADYDIDKSYWSLSKNGEILQSGVDKTKISDGDHYEITYIK